MSNPSLEQRGELGFSLLLVVFSATAFWQSYAISGFSGLATAGVFPMLASATMLLAAVCILIKKSKQLKINSADEMAYDAHSKQGFFRSILPLQLVVVVALITGYVIAMPLFGFLLSSAAFLFLSFGYLWRKSIVVTVLITLASVVSVYLIFRKLFVVVLPKGTLIQGWF